MAPQSWRSLRPGQPGRVAGRNRSSPRRSQRFPCGLAASPEGFLVTQTSVGSSRRRSQGGLVHPVNGCRGDAEFGGSRTIGSAGASPAGAFRWRCTAAVVGSSLTRKTLYRGGILGDSLGSRVHLPLSVERLGKNVRNIGLPQSRTFTTPSPRRIVTGRHLETGSGCSPLLAARQFHCPASETE